jgi:hypothetical protein
MEALTLATNAIIGLSVTLQLLMLVNYLVSRQEYVLLATATDNLIGTINYRLNRTLRSLWSRYYELQDNLTGYNITSVNYFLE